MCLCVVLSLLVLCSAAVDAVVAVPSPLLWGVRLSGRAPVLTVMSRGKLQQRSIQEDVSNRDERVLRLQTTVLLPCRSNIYTRSKQIIYGAMMKLHGLLWCVIYCVSTLTRPFSCCLVNMTHKSVHTLCMCCVYLDCRIMDDFRTSASGSIKAEIMSGMLPHRVLVLTLLQTTQNYLEVSFNLNLTPSNQWQTQAQTGPMAPPTIRKLEHKSYGGIHHQSRLRCGTSCNG